MERCEILNQLLPPIELKAELWQGGSPSLYSCQLDAVVGDVREATRRRARGEVGGRLGGRPRKICTRGHRVTGESTA